MKKVISAMVLLIMVLLTKPLQAQVYNFTQTGFNGGGTITGSFTGVDSNNDGIIFYNIWNISEVTDFTMSFTGDSYVTDKTFTSANTLEYTLGSAWLTTLESSFYNSTSDFLYMQNYDPSDLLVSEVYDYNENISSATVNTIFVTAGAPTPEPGTWALMGIGGLLAAFQLRKSGIASAFSI